MWVKHRGSGIRQNSDDFALAARRNSGEFRYEKAHAQLQKAYARQCVAVTLRFGLPPHDPSNGTEAVPPVYRKSDAAAVLNPAKISG
jgi:hypothetical protein